MRYALTAEQMRSVEERAVAEGRVTLGQLMERAGEALAAEVQGLRSEGAVVVVCGPGNNGGDGWVAARRLLEAGRDVHLLALAAPGELKGEAAEACGRARAAGLRWEEPGERAAGLIERAEIIVDAVFGIGFRGTPREPFARVLDLVSASRALVVSADVPSGVNADTGAAEGAVGADVTVTFTAPKPGLLLYPGAERAGQVVVADLGIPAEWTALAGALEIPDAADLRPSFPMPRADDHKGTRGRVALVVGSSTYPGAAVLAARGALSLGAGFTVVVVPEPIADIVRSSGPGLLVRPVPASPDGAMRTASSVLSAIADADAVVAGPGLTPAGPVREVVGALVSEVDRPLVLDADALNVLDGPGALRGRRAPVVIAPHPGEAGRLLGSTAAEVQADRLAASRLLCDIVPVCLLKGARTIVSGGHRRAVVPAGNAGLAKAGSGDVLAGMIGTLLAQGVAPYDAAVLGAFLHGRAAEYGTRRMTMACFTSADITTFLPDAVREVTGE